MFRKIIGVVLCLSVLVCLTGCESQDVKDAKECIDQIIKATTEIAENKYTISVYSGSSSQEGMIKKAQAQQSLSLNERIVEISMERFRYLYQNMSEKEQQIIKDYLDEAYLSYLIDIWD